MPCFYKLNCSFCSEEMFALIEGVEQKGGEDFTLHPFVQGPYFLQ